MWKVTSLVATAAAVTALAGTVIASQATPAKTAKPAAAMSAVGKIEKYDAASRTLTLTTSKGEQSFVLASNATVHQGSKTMQADDIASQSGHRAKVRYSSVNGQKTADAVMILSTSTASAQKPASKQPSK